VIGDLVYEDFENAREDVIMENESEEREGVKSKKKVIPKLPKLVIVDEELLKKVSIEDVLLPIPGVHGKFPTHEVGNKWAYYRFVHGQGGHLASVVGLAGLAREEDNTRPVGEREYNGVKIAFNLPSSSCATMALRQRNGRRPIIPTGVLRSSSTQNTLIKSN